MLKEIPNPTYVEIPPGVDEQLDVIRIEQKREEEGKRYEVAPKTTPPNSGVGFGIEPE